MDQPRTQNNAGDFFADDRRNIWILFGACALFNIVLSFLFRAPYAYPDEYGVFANGNWMFGSVSWDYKSNMYYGYTFSPFVGLLMQFFKGIRQVYIGALCIKAIQMSFIPVLTYKLLREVLDSQDNRVNILLSFAMCLYPAIVLYAKYVSNETTLHLILFLCVYLFGKCAVCQEKGRTRIYSAILGFLGALAYATHGMGLSFIVAICFVVPVAHFLTKKRLVSYPIFIVSLLAFYLLDVQIKTALLENVYIRPEIGAVNTFDVGINGLLNNATIPGAIWSVVYIFLARLIYISAATFGAFPLAAIAMLVFVFGFLKLRFTRKPLDAKNIPLFVVTLFCFAIFMCGLSLSSLVGMGPLENLTGKSLLYGRYYEYMALPLIAVGFHYLFSKDFPRKTWLVYSGLVLVIYTILSIYIWIRVSPVLADGTSNYFFTLGIVPYIGNTSIYIDVDSETPMYINMYTMWLFTVSIFSAMMYLIIFKNFRRMALGVLTFMFLYGTIYDLKTTVLYLSVANYDYFYSYLEPVRVALDDFKDVYDQYPNLYVISNSVGSEDSPSSLYRGRPQLSFFDYSVAALIRPHLLNEVADPQSLFDNAILVSDEDVQFESLSILEGYEEYAGFTKIYESPTAYIWIRGDDITAYYNSR